MKYVRNAEGLEVIPNVGFWSGLPSLIKVQHIVHLLRSLF